MGSNSLEGFYDQLGAGAAGAAADLPRAAGHFNVFRVEDLMLTFPHRPAMPFDRREFYKISLVRGQSRVEYADQLVDIRQRALWFASSRVPYRWLPHTLAQAGYFCIFTEDFLRAANGGAALAELPVFQAAGCPVLELSEADYAALEAVFEKMTREMAGDYAYKYELLRTYLQELIYVGQKLQPVPAPAPAPPASARLTALFVGLLERQFPLATPQQQLRLRTATDYAGQLAVHVNHLNRVLKETTGHTTSALIGSRVAQEAKLLLRHTNWTVSEVAVSLGFADVAHFCNFFKRQTSRTPGDFRV